MNSGVWNNYVSQTKFFLVVSLKPTIVRFPPGQWQTYEMADGDNWDAARIEHERANAHCEWDEEGHQEQIALEHQRDIVKYKIQKNVYGISRRQGNRRGGYAVRRNDGLRAAQ
eukprot:Lankesteria_metandrocarpae@DN5377_c0_g1_i27.p1